ncbi:MAG: hypothetical protein AAF597_11455, partial [Bacteroidota bacterium]
MSSNSNYLLLVLLGTFTSLNLHAHQDRWFEFQENNVIVRMKTGHEYEEIKKAEMLAKMANDLVESLAYCRNIQIDFIHNYTYDQIESTF